MTADEIIAHLGLAPLPREGGWFRETYRAGLQWPASALAARYPGPRAAGTAIYYLLTPESFSALHRLTGDEVFHFYLGDPVEMLQLDPRRGEGRFVVFGTDLLAGQRPQEVVPAGVWQGSRLLPGGAFALLGTTMAPGFDPADYEGANAATLAAAFPAFSEAIRRLCPARDGP